MRRLIPSREARGRRGRRGNALVELTLSLTFLSALFTGVWQFGYAFYTYAKLEQAVRDGARYAAIAKYESATSTPTSAFLTAVRNVVVYGAPSPPADPSPVPVAQGLSPADVNLVVTFASGVPVGMTVAINGYKMPAYFGDLRLTNKPLAWFPYTGTFGPP